MIILVSYDLHAPNKDYTALYSALNNIGKDRFHFLESVWLFDTVLTSNEVFAKIKGSIDEDDRVFVVVLKRDYSGWLTQNAWDWLTSRSSF